MKKTKAKSEIDSSLDRPWTKKEFAKAKSPEEVLPPNILSQFKKHRGPQKTPTKIPVSVRLHPQVVKYFKSKGPGWQTKIDEVLQKAAGIKDKQPTRHHRHA